MAKKSIPKFKSEAEEAQWYYEHQDELEDYLQPYLKSFVPLHVELDLPARKRPLTKAVPLRIPLDDLDRARKIAARKGIPYQTFLKMLIQEGLGREESPGR